MIGKKNIVFGFIYLVFTAALGVVMVDKYEAYGAAVPEKQSSVGRLQQLQTNNFEEMLEPLSGEQIAKANTAGILSLNKLLNLESGIDAIKGGPHAHGNLESLLNIAVGLVLGFLAVNVIFKQVISWIFIAGALLHSGMLYLGTVFGMGWANSVLETGIGPFLILIGLALAGIAAAIGFRAEPVKDRGGLEFAIARRELVARQLLGQEAIEGLVAIERVDHVIAEPPRIGQRPVVFKTLGLRKSNDVEPDPGEVLAVTRARQQSIDQLLVGVGRAVLHKRLHPARLMLILRRTFGFPCWNIRCP